MKINTAYYTNVGTTKQENQDSLLIKVVNSPYGKIVFAVICDGVGGLAQGEMASKEIVEGLNEWLYSVFF